VTTEVGIVAMVSAAAAGHVSQFSVPGTEVRRVRTNHSTAAWHRASSGYGRRVPRIARSTLPDGLFHVIARGVYDTRIYRDEADRRWFLKLLRRSEHTHGWTCHAFCLMTTHYHLVLETTRLELSRGLHQLNGRYARGFNGRYSRYGHLFRTLH